MSKKDWFVDWFDTAYYHVLYRNRDEKEAERFIQKLMDYLNLPSNSSLLDLACGKGRHAKFLSEFGHQVLGVDLSPNSIAAASQWSNEQLRFQTHDMREILQDTYFDVVFNLFTSFGYFDDESENQQVCSSIAHMLKPEGLLVIDFMNATKVISRLVTEEVKTIDGIEFRISRHSDEKHIYKNIEVLDGDINVQYMERVQALKLTDFRSLLASKFEILNTFGSYDLTPFEENTSDRLILIARLK
ncbi:MAG: class I SAM-dependent methyltransferase [Crocinitomicaceae bacterium]